MRHLLDKIQKNISFYSLFKPSESLLVGLSGGPDSVFLLRVLQIFSRRTHYRLFAVHVNHGLRQKASVDEAFVRRLCEREKIPLFVKKVPTKRHAKKNNLSIEEAARDLRYQVFEQAAMKFKVKKIVLAHTRDDQAETVFMRLFRGAGLLGLAGMSSVREFGDLKIIRPLLAIDKNEILEVLEKEKVQYRRDESNESSDYHRNRLRNEIFPELEKVYSNHYKNALIHLAEDAQESYSFIQWEAKKFVILKKGKMVQWDRVKFLNLARALQKEVFAMAYSKLLGNRKALSRDHLERMAYLSAKSETGSYDLARGIRFESSKKLLILRFIDNR